MLSLWWSIATAAPPTPVPDPAIEVVPYEEVEGRVRIVFPGREGDTLRVDGMIFGVLPIETELVEGIHQFRVDGAKGRFQIQTAFAAKPDEVVDLDLSKAKPPPPVAPVKPLVTGQLAAPASAPTLPDPPPPEDKTQDATALVEPDDD